MGQITFGSIDVKNPKVRVFKNAEEVKKPNTKPLLKQQIEQAITEINRLLELVK